MAFPIMGSKDYPNILSITIEAKADTGSFVEVAFNQDYEEVGGLDFYSSYLSSQGITLGHLDLARWQIAIEFADGNTVVYG